jgi:DNA-binding CsgD family transcriptional regulator
MARGHQASRPAALVERTVELREIDRLLRAAAAGRGGGLIVEGPPGIGKTALVSAARRRADRRGLTVLAARGGELEVNFPYGVVRQLFEPVIRSIPASSRRALLSGAARPAAPIVAESDPAESAQTDETSPDAMFARAHGLYWLAVNLSLRGPILLAVDDAQWSDGPSIRFLRYLGRRLDGLALGLLCTVRSGEARQTEPGWLPELAVEPLMQIITPAALGEQAVGQIVAAGLGQTSDAAFTTACRTATGGIPFLVHELVATLAADSVEPTAEHATVVNELGPATVARATLTRLQRMPEGCAQLARATAILAGEATLPHAAALADLSDAAALAALDALILAGVISARERLEFAHPIVRAAIYDDLGPGERSKLHSRAASLLAAAGAELDAIAAQLMCTEPVGAPEVIFQLRRAATHAMARGAPENAVAFLTRALEEGGDRELRAALCLELALAERLAQPGPAMVEHLREAHRLAEEPVLGARAALELATALGLTGQWDEGHRIVEDSLERLGDLDEGLRVRLESLRAAISAGDPRIVADFNRRLPMLHALVSDNPGSARALAMLLGSVAAWRGESSASVLALVELGWSGGRALHEGLDFWGLTQGLTALVVAELPERAIELADAVLADARARGSALGFVQAIGMRSWLEARNGQLAIAEGGLRAALEPIREHGHYFALPSLLFCGADVMLERPQAAADLVALVQTLWLGPMMDTFTGALLLDVRGRLRDAAGDRAGAIEDLTRAGEICRALSSLNPNGLSWRSALAMALPLEERDEARRLVRDELADAQRIGHPRAIGTALRTLGLLDGGAAGRRLLEQAAATLEHSAARLEYARALVELGAAMRRAGERSAAREPLAAGLDLAVAGGADRLAERARTELAASGARPRRLRVTGRDALTPSELRVARIAAEGATNNEVAQALFITPKTVDTHLSRAYAKLGIASRRDLAAALAAQAAA